MRGALCWEKCGQGKSGSASGCPECSAVFGNDTKTINHLFEISSFFPEIPKKTPSPGAPGEGVAKGPAGPVR
jgi:hypothetical protein